jgi:hypothetical protein
LSRNWTKSLDSRAMRSANIPGPTDRVRQAQMPIHSGSTHPLFPFRFTTCKLRFSLKLPELRSLHYSCAYSAVGISEADVAARSGRKRRGKKRHSAKAKNVPRAAACLCYGCKNRESPLRSRMGSPCRFASRFQFFSQLCLGQGFVQDLRPSTNLSPMFSLQRTDRTDSNDGGAHSVEGLQGHLPAIRRFLRSTPIW